MHVLIKKCNILFSLIDCFLLDTAAVSIAFSPTSELLATCHIDELGIYLWSNRAIFTHVSLRPLPYDFNPADAVELPGTSVMVILFSILLIRLIH